ncbi:hypothetical protein JHK85_004842 [Glycine max]|nr:hypothetical protein JHK85_004842 [Glycine max]
MHRPARRTVRRHPFVDRVMEADIPLGWKPLNLKRAHYATSRSHRITSATLASPRQVDNESLRKFMDRFGRTTIQIQNLNPEVVLHSMLLTLRPGKFTDSQTITQKEQDPEDIKMSNIGSRKQIEEDRKTESEKDASHNGVSGNLHQNRNLPNT